MVDALEAFGIKVEAAHHEVAAGQHEIDFEYADALKTADNAITFKFALKAIASSTACTRRSCPSRSTASTARACTPTRACGPSRRAATPSRTPTPPTACPRSAKSYMAGILAHARGMIAILAPAREQLQAPGPGLRGPDVHHLGPHQPLRAHPRPDDLARQVHRGHPRRGPLPGPVLQHLPRLRRDDRGGPGRRGAGAGAPRAHRGEPVRDGRRPDRREGHPRAARAPSARPSTSSRPIPSSPRPSATTSCPTTSPPSGPSGTSTAPRSRSGSSTATSKPSDPGRARSHHRLHPTSAQPSSTAGVT